MAARIRILFVNCPTLNLEAATFLLLAQNQHQTAIQFEVQHYWFHSQSDVRGNWIARAELWLGDKFGSYPRWTQRRATARLDLAKAPVFAAKLSIRHWFAPVKEVINNYDGWFAASRYSKFDVITSPTIVITETPLSGNYLSVSQDDVGVISTANWERYFAPGAGLEYVLHGVQRLAARLCFGNALSSHFSTRGCVWDFNAHQPDSRIGAFTGFFCETCVSRLNQQNPQLLEPIQKLASNSWIGTIADRASVAFFLKKHYGYDLSRSEGLSSSRATRFFEAGLSELAKLTVEIFKYVAIGTLTLLIALKFPGIYTKLRSIFGS